jgi:uncharacterized protein (DUF427 family)
MKALWNNTVIAEANKAELINEEEVNEGGVGYYPQRKDGSIERVKNDFKNYVAFWRGVQVGE